MHRPQRTHGCGAASFACFSRNTRMPLFCLSTGKSTLASAVPIMGPPISTLAAPSSMPPQKSSTSRMGVPMMTSAFFGSFTPGPSTVRRFVVSGMPVARNLPSADTVVTFITSTPTSAGRPPRGTSRPVVRSISTFSAPCG